MRILGAALAAALTVGVCFPVLAADSTGQAPPDAATRQTTPVVPAAPPAREKQLDGLFIQLKAAPDEATARTIERNIEALWMESGSPTADLLMTWADKAVEGKDYPLALDYLDRIIIMQPDYVEAWNRRATVYYLVDKYARALSDIEHVLALEPRHFVALAGLGTILRGLGEDTRALKAYREALALDPHLTEVAKAVKELTAKGAGGVDL